MKAVWTGGSNSSPNTISVRYGPVQAALGNGTLTTNEAFVGQVSSENVTITKLTLQTTTAPGSGKSWTFTFRESSVDTAAQVVLSGTNTSVTWNGSVNITAGNFLTTSILPAGSPTQPGAFSWIIEYTTGGNYYVNMRGPLQGVTAQTRYTQFLAYGGNLGTSAGTSEVETSGIFSGSGTITKALFATGTIGSAATETYALSARVAGADYLTTALVSPSLSNSSTGSVSFSAGDTISLKVVHTGISADARISVGFTIYPTVLGEIYYPYGHAGAISTTAVSYAIPIPQLNGVTSAWAAAESGTQATSYGYDMKNLYIKLGTAPGSGKSRTFVYRHGGVSTALTATVSNTATTASDTTNTISTSLNTLSAFMSTPSGTPAANGSVYIGTTLVVPQSFTGTKTQAATASIAQTITKTQPATARVSTSVTKTQPATAKIATVITKTQTATARVAQNLTKTQSATANIQPIVFITKTQIATARIAKTVTKTQPAVARIARNLTKTQPAVSRISKTFTKTQPSISRIAKTVTKTQPATAKIAKTVARTQPATARINTISFKTQTAIARISKSFTKTQPATARIGQTGTKTQPAIARIAKNSTKTQPANARIAGVVTKTQTATAKIASKVYRTQPAVARIANVYLGGLWWWNGVKWVSKPVKVWNGSAWVVKPLKRWNGTQWVTLYGSRIIGSI